MSALAVTVPLGRAFFQFIDASPYPCTLKTSRGRTMLEGYDLQLVSGFGGDAFRVPAETVCQWIHTREGGQLLGDLSLGLAPALHRWFRPRLFYYSSDSCHDDVGTVKGYVVAAALSYHLG